MRDNPHGQALTKASSKSAVWRKYGRATSRSVIEHDFRERLVNPVPPCCLMTSELIRPRSETAGPAALAHARTAARSARPPAGRPAGSRLLLWILRPAAM
jgi:hypothetical protein